MKRLLFLLFLWGGGWIAAHAQEAALSGTITDRSTGEPLPGASIEIARKDGQAGKRRDIHLLSGLNGDYVWRNIIPGVYEVSVKYVGFERFSKELRLGDQPVRLSVGLESSQRELATVSVSAGSRGSEKASMLADRRADILQNSVSSRAIEISPDLTVASTAQRVSGVTLERSTNGEAQYVIVRGMDKRYIYTLVNNVKIPSPDNKNRYVPLDIFPADMLERLEIFKSLTPNMEGDAIGGAVNMVMKDAPAKFSLNANAAVGYADRFFSQDFTAFDHSGSLNRSPRDLRGDGYSAGMSDFPLNMFDHHSRHNPIGTLAGLSLGGRLFGGKLGVMVAGSYQNNYRNVSSVYFGTQVSQADGSAVLSSVENRHYSIQQERSGLHARLDYRINENNKINLYAAYLNLMRQEYRYVSDTNLLLHRVGPGFGRVSNSYRDLYDQQRIVHTTIKGEHRLNKDLWLDWTGSYSKATFNRPDEGTLNVDGGVDQDPVTGAKVETLPALLESSREFSHSTDEDKSGYLNFHYKTLIGEGNVDWSIGGMYRDKNRVSTYDDYSLRPDSTRSTQYYYGSISGHTFYVFNPEGTSDDALNYTSREKVGAAYAMLKAEYGRWLVTGGARYEHTDLSWNSNVPKTKEGKTGSINYYDVLPSGAIKYTLSRKQVLRLSYYSAISRPNFYEVIPHTGGNPDADITEAGNPNLKRTTADNFDLRYEYFPKGLDQLLAGVFYKHLKNPIEYARTTQAVGTSTGGTNEFIVPENFGNARNYGAEIDVTKYWRWFGVKANYTYTNSSITTNKTLNYSVSGGTTSKTVQQTRPLQGQSKHIANLSLLFKDDNKLGLNAQLAFGYTSRRIDQVSQYYNNDTWQKDFEQMDFSVEKRVTRHWYVYAKINNILNTPYELELQQPYVSGNGANSAPFQQDGKKTFVRKDTYGANYLFGVKFKM